MNTTEILNKSLTWLYYKERKTTGTSRSISNLQQGNNTPKSSRIAGYDIYEKNNYGSHTGIAFTSSVSQATEPTDLAQVAPQELYILTQVILNTLNTEPERFHDMSEIPGLENREWNQLGQIALYLMKQGWIEAKGTATGFLIRLSMQGKIYLGNNEAWA